MGYGEYLESQEVLRSPKCLLLYRSKAAFFNKHYKFFLQTDVFFVQFFPKLKVFIDFTYLLA